MFFIVGSGDAAAGLALPIRIAVGRINVHVVDRAHSYRDTRLDMAVGWGLLVHGFVDVFGDAFGGDRWVRKMVSEVLKDSEFLARHAKSSG